MQQAKKGDVRACPSALGLLPSFVPALKLACLLEGWLSEQGQAEQMPDPREVSNVLGFWQELLPCLNGNPWHSDLRLAFLLVYSASEGAYDGHLRSSTWQANIAFPAKHRLATAAGRLSSTTWEVRGASWRSC